MGMDVHRSSNHESNVIKPTNFLSFIQCWDGLPSQGLTVLLPQPWSIGSFTVRPPIDSIPSRSPGDRGMYSHCLAIVTEHDDVYIWILVYPTFKFEPDFPPDYFVK